MNEAKKIIEISRFRKMEELLKRLASFLPDLAVQCQESTSMVNDMNSAISADSHQIIEDFETLTATIDELVADTNASEKATSAQEILRRLSNDFSYLIMQSSLLGTVGGAFDNVEEGLHEAEKLIEPFIQKAKEEEALINRNEVCSIIHQCPLKKKWEILNLEELSSLTLFEKAKIFTDHKFRFLNSEGEEIDSQRCLINLYNEFVNTRTSWKIMDKSKVESQKITTMIVDDDCLVRTFIKKQIHKSYPLVTVIECVNGEEALRILQDKTNSVDIIFLDYHMPKMDGVETLQEIQKRKINLDAPILMISNDLSLEEVMVSKNLQCSGFVHKDNAPKSIDNILRFINVALANNQKKEEEEAAK